MKHFDSGFCIELLCFAGSCLLAFYLFVLLPYAMYQSSFDVRCDKAYPAQPERALKCVYNLSKGLEP